MKDLNSKPIVQWYLIKNSIVFDIKKTSNEEDPCEAAYSAVTLPSVTVDGEKKYLDCFIEDGDIYSGSTFYKTVHPGSPEYIEASVENGGTPQDNTITYDVYFYRMCMNSIEAGVKKYFFEDTQFFLDNQEVFGVPSWFIKNNGNTVSPATCQFEIKEANIVSLKEYIVKKAAFDAAKAKTDYYGYELNSPAKPDDIQIKKMTE